MVVFIVYAYRNLLHHCFQALMDHGMNLATILSDAFSSRATLLQSDQRVEQERGLHLGLLLGKMDMLYIMEGESLHANYQLAILAVKK